MYIMKTYIYIYHEKFKHHGNLAPRIYAALIMSIMNMLNLLI